ncbi:hypothetical protein K503DRAFT_774303 [Rhizopogon vinicolor AM-OR11-026]|uniref:Uncharacterized protein n=1 Tax=Rhizopogon vinicolor AM-OR11-026 TaxID=1314800 RepID=A0A1B7MQ01_9AGAM|nr:hypothetical protein K503DRAFT_774303 [Rhizopogon vinicolor AM-OR11-026]
MPTSAHIIIRSPHHWQSHLLSCLSTFPFLTVLQTPPGTMDDRTARIVSASLAQVEGLFNSTLQCNLYLFI